MSRQTGWLNIPIHQRTAKALGRWLGLALLWAQAPTALADEVVMTASVVDGLYVNTTPRATFCARYNSTCNNSWTFDLPLTYAKMRGRMIHRTRTLRSLLAAGLLSFLSCAAALANEVVITADVRDGRYVNTTRGATYCNQYGLGPTCGGRWTFDLPLSYSKMVDVGAVDVRSRVYLNLPAKRSFTLVNQTNYETASAALEFRDVSQQVSYQTYEPVGPGVSGCIRNGGLIGGGLRSRHLWTFMGVPCFSTKAGNGELQDSKVTQIGVSVNPLFPDASKLSSGTWEGFITYSVGPGDEFDFGTTYEASTNIITVRVRIKVLHDIAVEFPEAGSTIALRPNKSWETGLPPTGFFHYSTIRLSAAGTFGVYLACQYPDASRNCSLRSNFGNHQVPLNVNVMLPSAFTHNGPPGLRTPLREGRANWLLVTPANGPVNGQSARLHFEIGPEPMKEMLAHRGSHYSGWVTIIYDANP